MFNTLSVEQITTIIGESWTLQRILAERLKVESEKNALIVTIENIVRDHGSNKIGAIKALRELGNRREIYPLFPAVEFNCDCGSSDAMGLADSKRLVEWVANSIGVPYPTYQ